MENTWEKGFIVRKVNGVPDSYIVEVDGQRYQRNKCDLMLNKPLNVDDSDSHSNTHDEPMATEVMLTLCPRPQLKFPRIPVQATEQKDFNIQC